MINGEEVLSQIQMGQIPSTWQVFPAKKSYFSIRVILYGVATVAFLVVLIYLNQSHTVIAYLRSGTSSSGTFDVLTPDQVAAGSVDSQTFQNWHLIDNVGVGVFALACAFLTAIYLYNLSSVRKQVLVLLPEGFVMRAEDKKPKVISYDAISVVGTKVSSSDMTLIMKRIVDGQTIEVTFDERFGAARSLVQRIEDAQRQRMMLAQRTAWAPESLPPDWAPWHAPSTESPTRPTHGPALDGEEVLSQVQAGQVPPTWQVLRARKATSILGAISFGILAIALLGGAISFRWWAPIAFPNSTTLVLTFTCAAVIIGLLFVVFGGLAVAGLIDLGRTKDWMLVLMPEGFVRKSKEITTIPYRAITEASMVITPGNYIHVIGYVGSDVAFTARRIADGTRVKVDFDSRFGSPKSLVQRIVEAQQHIIAHGF